MAMPIRAFWAFAGYANRLLTAEGIDRLEIIVAGQSADGAQDAFERMRKAAPNPVKFTGAALAAANSERDEGGFNELRAMSG